MRWFLLLILVLFPLKTFSNDLTQAEFKKLLELKPRTKGLALVVGTIDDGLSVLSATEFYTHILIAADGELQKGRKILDEKKLSHTSSVLQNEHDTRLPYGDNLLNLVVIAQVKDFKWNASEVLRVTAPQGVILVSPMQSNMIKELESAGIKLSKVGEFLFGEKPTPKGFDDWSHIKGGANQSFTNKDSEVGPWDEIRWIADPKWGSLYVSYTSFVSGGGIIYYQEAKAVNNIGKWFLIARDAYNGVELWRENIGGFLKYIRNPDYTYCADDKNIYYREESRQVSRDGLTGKKLLTFETKIPPEFALVEGKVLVLCSNSLMEAFDKKSGSLLWSQPISVFPAAENGTLFFIKDGVIKAVAIETGKELWNSQIPGFDTKKENNLFCKDENVYLSMKTKFKSDHILHAYKLKSGEKLWTYDGNWGYGTLPYKDDIWLLGYSNKAEDRETSVNVRLLKSLTGKAEKEFKIPGNAGGHCWGARGSETYLLYSNGWYYDRLKHEGDKINSTRSPCRLGQVPANGLTYFMPHHCDCKVTLRGFLGLAKQGTLEWVEKNENRLQTFKPTTPITEVKAFPSDWPIYRKNAMRLNTANEKIEGNIKLAWTKKLNSSKLSQATVAGGLVFISSKQNNLVSAFKEDNGELVWSFYTDGSVLSSPSIEGSYCLIGTGSGYIHCLHLKTGEELWRLRVAPVQKFIGDRGKLDSPWPVLGSILVKNKVAYFSVGRASSQDIGVFIYAVEVESGKIVWKQKFERKDGFCADMFLADDKKLSCYDIGFDYATGKMDKGFKLSPPYLKTTRYLSTVSLVNYMDSIDPNQTDKRHVYLTDGSQLGELVSSFSNVSVVAGRIATSYAEWEKKHGQLFLKAKGEFNWVLDNLDVHIFGLVTTKDKVFTTGVNPQTEKSVFRVYALADGKQLQELPIDGQPVYDALSISNGRIYLTTEEGGVFCFKSGQ